VKGCSARSLENGHQSAAAEYTAQTIVVAVAVAVPVFLPREMQFRSAGRGRVSCGVRQGSKEEELEKRVAVMLNGASGSELPMVLALRRSLQTPPKSDQTYVKSQIVRVGLALTISLTIPSFPHPTDMVIIAGILPEFMACALFLALSRPA